MKLMQHFGLVHMALLATDIVTKQLRISISDPVILHSSRDVDVFNKRDCGDGGKDKSKNPRENPTDLV